MTEEEEEEEGGTTSPLHDEIPPTLYISRLIAIAPSRRSIVTPSDIDGLGSCCGVEGLEDDNDIEEGGGVGEGGPWWNAENPLMFEDERRSVLYDNECCS